MKEAFILAGFSLLVGAAYEGVKNATGISKKLADRRANIWVAESMRLAFETKEKAQ